MGANSPIDFSIDLALRTDVIFISFIEFTILVRGLDVWISNRNLQ